MSRINHLLPGAIAVVLGVLLFAAPASALTKTVLTGQITGSGSTALTNPTGVAVDQQSHDVYVANPPTNQRQAVAIDATGGTFTLTFKGKTTSTKVPMNFGISSNKGNGANNVQATLEEISTVGKGNVFVSGPEGGPYIVEFTGALGGAEQPLITGDSSNLTGGGESITVSLTRHARTESQVEKFTPSGEFLYSLGGGVDETTSADQCTVPSHDSCGPGAPGSSPGAFEVPAFVTVDPTSDDFYVGDTGDDSITKFDSAGNLLNSWGNGGQLQFAEPLHGITVAPNGDLFALDGKTVYRYGPDGSPAGQSFVAPSPSFSKEFSLFGIAADSEGHLYAMPGGSLSGTEGQLIFRVNEFNDTFGEFVAEPSTTDNSVALAVDPASNDLYLLEGREPLNEFRGRAYYIPGGETVQQYALGCSALKNPGLGCEPLETLGAKTTPLSSFGQPELDEASGVAVDADRSVYLADTAHSRVAVFKPVAAPEIAASTNATSQTSLTFEGTLKPGSGGDVTECQFEYGPAKGEYSLGTLPCEPAPPYAGEEAAHADLSGLTPLTTYHFRLLAANAQAGNSSGDQTFRIPLAPSVGDESATEVGADSAAVHARIVAGGGQATFHVEYLSSAQVKQNLENGEEEFANAAESTPQDAGSAEIAQSFTARLGGLAPATEYDYRVVVENALEPARGTGQTFETQPFSPVTDACPNAHVRQQTSAEGLLDCRAYELVSAADTAGYDVESNAVPGQTPFGSYPDASDRVLYGVHNGGIPGTGNPTNRGVDPYVATRGESGWSTQYVGIPANGIPSAEAFGSPLLEADSGLDTFAFGGEGLCSPCFADGGADQPLTGVPLRLSSGELLQGMAGPEAPGSGAEPAGYVAKHLSADGTHFVFGSESKFTPDGNEDEISIYDRNLKTGESHAVSKTPGGQTMAEEGKEIGELDLSGDGSRIVIGHLVEEVEGVKYWHLYMNVGDSSATIDLTPGTTHGVLYDGMTADGSKVFFTTVDPLTGDDEDTSADLYEADVSGSSADLTRISTGSGAGPHGPGNTNACTPASNSAREHWNATGSTPNCGVVAIGGGGGVAPGDGTVYFLSPELLDGAGNGVQDAPNLYVVRPDSAPHFVATLESVLSGPQPPVLRHTFDHDFGSFSRATGVAVDNASGDVYVLDAGAHVVKKFDPQGNPVNFSFPVGSKEAPGNTLTGADTPAGSFFDTEAGPVQIAVDNDPSSPSYRDLYVPDFVHSVVDKFSPTGEFLGPPLEVTLPTGVAVDQANGHVYVPGFLSGTVAVFDAGGNPVAPSGFEASPTFVVNALAVDPTGVIYVANNQSTSVFSPAGNHVGIVDQNASTSVTVDSSNNDVYVDEGDRLVQFNSEEKELGTVGAGVLNGSSGVTINPGGNLYTSNSNGAEVAVFASSLAPGPLVDNPVVLDSVGSPASRHTADFQVTPDGDFAAFPSSRALAGGGEDPGGNDQVYRYDASSEALACVSCQPPGQPSSAPANLAQEGLSLLEDGRVFFDSDDGLVGDDTNNRQDAYEWEPLGTGTCNDDLTTFRQATNACLALISAGTGPTNSSLLGASADGTDAYFFTRDSLAPQDSNGPTMKIYDAREGGGFPYEFPPVGCRASDECHGPASAAPGPVQVGSEAGTPYNKSEERHCKKGFVRKGGKCVKRRKAHRHHHHHGRSGHHGGGGK